MRMAYVVRRPKEHWRNYLTDGEAREIKEIEQAQRRSERQQLLFLRIRARAWARASRAKKGA